VVGVEPRRRPRDRRQQIVAAAAELFCERGYHNVSLGDVAAVVGVTAPAVSWHFSSKEQLLRAAVDQALDGVEARLEGSATIEDLIEVSVVVPRQRHQMAAIWQREARHLPAEQRAELRGRANGIAAGIGQLIRTARPRLSAEDAELLSWAYLAVFASFATHRITMSRREHEGLVARIARSVVWVRLPRPGRGARRRTASTVPAADLSALPRREQLLDAAIELIAERGYQSVSMTEIGAAVGIAGPSIYKHYSAKSEMLTAALQRGHARLQADMAQALAEAATPAEAMGRLLAAHIGFTLDHSSLIAILVSERDELVAQERAGAYRVQRELVATWVGLLDQVVPGLSTAEARVTINVVFSVVNGIARTPGLATRPGIGAQLEAICLAILYSHEPTSQTRSNHAVAHATG
jgi:AcrR family transcriptional regulator